MTRVDSTGPRRTAFATKATKRNPNSLRRLMRMVRQDFHHMTQAELAGHLNECGNNYLGKQTRFTEQTVKNLETDRITATYVHLERYAWSVGLPTGLFLIYSRLMSKQHNTLLREITTFRAVIRDISSTISRHTTFDDKEELMRWSSIYETHDEKPKRRKK